MDSPPETLLTNLLPELTKEVVKYHSCLLLDAPITLEEATWILLTSERIDSFTINVTTGKFVKTTMLIKGKFYTENSLYLTENGQKSSQREISDAIVGTLRSSDALSFEDRCLQNIMSCSFSLEGNTVSVLDVNKSRPLLNRRFGLFRDIALVDFLTRLECKLSPCKLVFENYIASCFFTGQEKTLKGVTEKILNPCTRGKQGWIRSKIGNKRPDRSFRTVSGKD